MMHHQEVGRWGGMSMGFNFFGVLMLILLVVIVAGVILILVNLFKNKNESSTTKAYPQQEAIEILSQRYAKGELSEEEYVRMKRTLEGGDSEL